MAAILSRPQLVNLTYYKADDDIQYYQCVFAFNSLRRSDAYMQL